MNIHLPKSSFLQPGFWSEPSVWLALLGISCARFLSEKQSDGLPSNQRAEVVRASIFVWGILMFLYFYILFDSALYLKLKNLPILLLVAFKVTDLQSLNRQRLWAVKAENIHAL